MKSSDSSSNRPNNPGRRSASAARAASETETEFSSSGAQRPSSEEVARRAYQRWERSGGAHGDDQRHWYEAEQEMGKSPGER